MCQLKPAKCHQIQLTSDPYNCALAKPKCAIKCTVYRCVIQVLSYTALYINLRMLKFASRSGVALSISLCQCKYLERKV